MNRYFVCLFLSFCFLTVGCNPKAKETAAAPETRDVRLMTYNIRNGRGMDDSLSIARTAAVIKRVSPEAVAVQELDSMTARSGQTYVLGELAKLTGMKAYFAPAIDFDGGKYGIGMLCRETPLGVKTYPLPGREEARALLVVEFTDYVYACTHLSLTEEDRLASVEALKKLESAGKPLFIAGDWNDTPASAFMQAMGEAFTLLSDTAAYTFPASEPRETIDYIAVLKSWSGRVSCRQAEVVEAPVESDHRPIVVEVSIPQTARTQ